MHEAILALGHLGDPSAVGALLRLLGEEWPLALADATPDRHHVEAANLLVQALGRVGDDLWIPAVAHASGVGGAGGAGASSGTRRPPARKFATSSK